MIKAREGAAAQAPLGEVGSDALDQVQPQRIGGHKVELGTGMRIPPRTDAGLGVRRGVVEHQLQLKGFRGLAIQVAQEAQKFLVTMPCAAPADHFTGRGL